MQFCSKIKCLVRFILLIVIAPFCIGKTFAQAEELATQVSGTSNIDLDKEYRVGVEDVHYYPLFDFSTDGLDRPSFARDVLTQFFESENLKFKFVPLPIKRFDKWYAEHNIDFKFPDNVRWHLDKKELQNVTYSEPVIEIRAGTYVLKENANVSRKQITRLSTIRGFHPTLWRNEVANNTLTIQEDTLPISVVKQVLYGYSDGTNIDQNVIRENLKKIGREGDIVLAKNIYHQDFYYHLSSINHPEIITKFNQFLKNNQEFLAKTKAKYNILE